MWDKIAAIGGLLAGIAGAVSAIFAYESADTAWTALRSSTVYQIQKDSVDVARDYVDKKVGPGAVMAKLYAIYYQRQQKIIDDPLWALLNYEYCRMLQSDKSLQEFWDRADKALYGKDFTDYVSGLRGGKKCE